MLTPFSTTGAAVSLALMVPHERASSPASVLLSWLLASPDDESDSNGEDQFFEDALEQPKRKPGRPLGSRFESRRPQQPDKWWSVTQQKWDTNEAERGFDKRKIDNTMRWTRAGRAQELGTARTGGACKPCRDKGTAAAAECKVHDTHRACGRCLWLHTIGKCVD